VATRRSRGQRRRAPLQWSGRRAPGDDHARGQPTGPCQACQSSAFPRLASRATYPAYPGRPQL